MVCRLHTGRAQLWENDLIYSGNQSTSCLLYNLLFPFDFELNVKVVVDSGLIDFLIKEQLFLSVAVSDHVFL